MDAELRPIEGMVIAKPKKVKPLNNNRRTNAPMMVLGGAASVTLAGILVACVVNNGDVSDPNLTTMYTGAPITDGVSLRNLDIPSVVGNDQTRCGLMFDYYSLKQCKGQNQNYIDAVNRHAENLKMDWKKVLEWSDKCRGKDARAILVSAMDVDVNSEAGRKKIRDGLRHVWGDAVDTMPILPTQSSITNTKEQDQMIPFPDGTPQVRVTLVPLDEECKPIATSEEGIMADCLNGWWILGFAPAPVTSIPSTGTTKVTVTTTAPPPRTTTTRTTPPPPTTRTTVPPPPTTRTTVTPPPTTETTVPCRPGTEGPHEPFCKDLPTNDPYPNGNAPQGGGPRTDPLPEDKYRTPEQMETERPPVEQPAPPPSPSATPPPAATSTQVAPPPVESAAVIPPEAPGATDGEANAEVDDS